MANERQTMLPDGETVISVHSVSRRYGELDAVKSLDLEVKRGEIFGFLGPNGAGKTTMIRMLMGLMEPTEGLIRIFGLDVHGRRTDVMQRLGFLPDHPVFHDSLRATELATFVAHMHGLKGAAARARVEAVLKQVELLEDADDFATRFSLGMRKRLGLALALVHEPELLILDEPTIGLDPHGTQLVKQLLQQHAARGGTVFLSTHLLEVAEQFCDRVAILDRGQLVALGTPAELCESLRPGARLEDVFLARAPRQSSQTGGPHASR